MRAVCVLLLALLSLSGCSALLERQEEFPLRRDRPAMVLTQGAEMTAALRLTRAGIVEEYLLALRGSGDGMQGAVLTPQGIPLASFVSGGSKPHVTTHVTIRAAMGELLSPLQLVQYLELSYLSVDKLSARLKSDWCVRERQMERVLGRHCAEQEPGAEADGFTIAYRGSKPWYSKVELHDMAAALTMQLQVLEHSNALSE